MKAPSPPPTPDPYKTAAAQQMANVEVAIANTFLQNADEIRPDGTVTWQQTGETLTTYTYDQNGTPISTRAVPKFRKLVQFTAEGQLQFSQQQQIAINLNTWALAQISLLASQQQVPITLADLIARAALPVVPTVDTSALGAPTLIDDLGIGDLTVDLANTRDAIDSRLQWQIDQDRAQLTAQLAHQGLVPGMTAYTRALEQFAHQTTDARKQAWLAAQQEQSRVVQVAATMRGFTNDARSRQFELERARRLYDRDALIAVYQLQRDQTELIELIRAKQLQERVAIRAQNINEISTLMNGGQIQVPQFQGFNPGRIDRTPVIDAVYQSAAMDMQKWQARVQQQQQMLGGLLGFGGNLIGGMMALSDRRLKTDVVTLGTDARGVTWSTWRYLWDAPTVRRLGVMAQDVPWAAVELPGGWLAVDYARLT